MTQEQMVLDYRRVAQAIQFLENNFREQPDLAAVAAHVGLSEYHFQRLFTRWAGTSPKRFLQFLTLQYAKDLLAQSTTVLDATYETGLSSPGRLHDLFVTLDAVTPGEYKRRGAELTIRYGVHPTPFGEALLAMTERGICGLSFVPEGARQKAVQEIAASWPQSELVEDAEQTRPFIEQIFRLPTNGKGKRPLPLHVKGTNFQVNVWQALLRIPAGMVASYEDVARLLGNPQAARAVGGAVGKNPVAYLIPCHRVVRKAGQLGNYNWGATRKKAMVGWEAAHTSDQWSGNQ